MATTENIVLGNGGDTYSFSFPYLKIEDVQVELQEYDTVNDIIVSNLKVSNFTIPSGNPTIIIFDAIGADTVYQTAPDGDVRVTSTNGYQVRIRIFRSTNIDATPSTFFAGSAIRAQDLNTNFEQILNRLQESDFSTNVDMNNNLIRNLATPTVGGDAANKSYVDTQDNLQVSRSGDSMSGVLNMGGNKITNLAAAVDSTDAVSKNYVDARLGDLEIPGFTRWRKVATAGQTVFSGAGDYGGTLSYSATREQVFLNGAQLQRDVDYTAGTGTSITLTTGAVVGDIVEVICVNNLNSSTSNQSQDLFFVQSGTGATTRTVESKLRDVVSVKDFGAVGDGVADDTAAIQAALDYIAAYTTSESAYNRGARSLFVPAGNYKCNSPLTLAPRQNLTIFGEGGASCIYGTHGGTTLKVGDASVKLMINFTMKDLSIAGSTTGTLTTDKAIHIERLYGYTFENCTFSFAHTCFHHQGGIHGFIRGCQFRRTNNDNEGGAARGINLLLDTTSAGGTVYGNSGVHILDCEFMGPDGANPIEACIKIRHIDGLYLSNSHLYQADYCLWIDPDGVNNNGITSIMATNVYFDTCYKNNIYFSGQTKDSGTSDTTSKLYREFQFDNCYFRAAAKQAVLFQLASTADHPLENVLFDNCAFRRSGLVAIINNSPAGKVTGYKINNSTFDSCNLTGGGVSVLSDSNAVNVSVHDCVVSDVKGLIATPNLSAFSLTPAAGATLSIKDNTYDVSFANKSPLTLGNYGAANANVFLDDQATDVSGVSAVNRTWHAEISASTTSVEGVFNVLEGQSGVCEYTIHGSDSANAEAGFQSKAGYFAFRRSVGGSVTTNGAATTLNQTFGTLGSNTVTVGVAANQWRFSITNNHTNNAIYSINVRVILHS